MPQSPKRRRQPADLWHDEHNEGANCGEDEPDSHHASMAPHEITAARETSASNIPAGLRRRC